MSNNDRESLSRLAGGELRELLTLLQGTDVEELELEVAGTKLSFKRTATALNREPLSSEGGATTVASAGPVFVVADWVGFFHAPGEDAGPAAALGDWVEAGQVLGAIDSLTVPHPVQAQSAGRLAEVLVEDGQPVEYGQPLFVLQPGEDR